MKNVNPSPPSYIEKNGIINCLLFSLDERAIAAYQVGCENVLPSHDFRQRLKQWKLVVIKF